MPPLPYAFMASTGTSLVVPLLEVSVQYRIQVSRRIDLAVDTLVLQWTVSQFVVASVLLCVLLVFSRAVLQRRKLVISEYCIGNFWNEAVNGAGKVIFRRMAA